MINRSQQPGPGAPCEPSFRKAAMTFINKSSVMGFILGFIVGPVVVVGGLYLYVRTQLPDLGEIKFDPPEIITGQKVSLDWSVQELDGTEVQLDKRCHDKVVFLNFWATWCPPCVGEMPSIQRLYERFKGRMAFFCVSNEDPSKIEQFSRGKNFTFPLYRIHGSPPETFQTDGIPATFIISSEGEILLKHVGGADWGHHTVVDFLEGLVNEGA